jgi:GNAT superfamily N-acetyltransferase
VIALSLATADEVSDETISAVADLYEDVYVDQLLSDPFYSPERFAERLKSYMKGPEFRLITATDEGLPVGFLYGYMLPEGSRWWDGVQPRLDEEFRREDSNRTFALNDMVVRQGWRRRGVASAMHGEMLRVFPGRRFTLLVVPGNLPARLCYQSWGYRLVGVQQPFSDSPVYDTMLFPTETR